MPVCLSDPGKKMRGTAGARQIGPWLLVSSVAASLALTSAATANDLAAFEDLRIAGEWAVDCRLPPGPTNQHSHFTLSGDGHVVSFVRNGMREFSGALRNIKIISATRASWTATINETTTDVVIERNGSRYRALESVSSDGKVLIKNSLMVERGFGAPWLEKCTTRPATEISAQVMLDTYRDCSGRDHDRAISGCTELIRMQPGGPFAYYHRALAYEAAHERDKALADVTEAIRLDPLYANAYNSRAWIYFKAGQLPQGLADIQRSLDLMPTDAASLDTRAHIYEAMGRREDAVSDYQRALTLLPETHPQFQPTRDALKRLGAPAQ